MFRLIRNSLRSVSRLPVCFIKPIAKSHLANRFSTAAKDAPVEVKPPVKIIYEYNHPHFFRNLNILGLVQTFVFFNFIEYYYKKVDEKVGDDEEIAFPFFKSYKVKMKKFQKIILGIFAVLVPAIWVIVIFYTTRSVKCIALRRRDRVTIVTYTPLGRDNAITVPLKRISGYRYRTKDESYLPLKIKNKWFYYLIDMRGEFKDPETFDHVINVSRTIK